MGSAHLENHRDFQGPVNTGHVWNSRLDSYIKLAWLLWCPKKEEVLLTVFSWPPPLLTVSRLAFPSFGCLSWTTVFPTGRGMWSTCHLLFHKRHISGLNLHLRITTFSLVPLLTAIKTLLHWWILLFFFSTSLASAIPSLYLAIDCSPLFLPSSALSSSSQLSARFSETSPLYLLIIYLTLM